MSYNNNYNNQRGYSERYVGKSNQYNGNGSRNYGRNYSGSYSGNRGGSYGKRANARHSDCTKLVNHVTKQGVLKEVIVRGWKYTRRSGLVSFVATPAASKYQKNEAYITMVAKITSTFGEKLVWCMWNKSKKILNFPSMNMSASADKRYWSFLTPKK